MKKLIVSAAALLVLSASPVLACDQQEAVDLMVKVSTALGEKAGAAKTEEVRLLSCSSVTVSLSSRPNQVWSLELMRKCSPSGRNWTVPSVVEMIPRSASLVQLPPAAGTRYACVASRGT